MRGRRDDGGGDVGLVEDGVVEDGLLERPEEAVQRLGDLPAAAAAAVVGLFRARPLKHRERSP